MENIHNNKHLTLHDRKIIEDALKDNLKLSSIALMIGKDDRTISKEIKRNRTLSDGSSRRAFCNVTNKHFDICPKLFRFPFVCNGCKKNCPRDHYRYYAADAQRKYELRLSESRQGYDLTPEELAMYDKIISEGVKNGQSIYAIKQNNPELKPSIKSLYNYVDYNIFQVKNIDLRRKVKLKPRAKKYDYKKEYEERECLIGRKIEDYFNFLLNNPGINTVQLDTVEGSKDSKKCFMTLHFVNFHFMLVYLLDSQTPNEISRVFNEIQDDIGIENFKRLFPCILTDRGKEFVDPYSIEFDPHTSELRTNIFYCDAYVSNQKAQIEKNHTLIRYIVPKGTYLNVFEPRHTMLITDNINSYPRKELSGNTPYELMALYYGTDILNALKINKVDRPKVNLTPSLLIK